MSRTTRLAGLLILATATGVPAAPPQRKTAPMTQFARVVFQQNSREDRGRWIGQTAVRVYRNPVSKIEVVFVSMSHVGDLAYFRGLTKYTRDASLVLFEGIGEQPPGKRLKDDQLPELGRWIRRNHAVEAAFMGQRLQGEWEAAVADKRWKRADLTTAQLKRVLSKLGGPILTEEQKDSIASRETVLKTGSAADKLEARIKIVNKLIKQLADRKKEALGESSPMERLSWHRERIMWRELERAVESNEHKRITVVVGAEHTRVLAPRLVDQLLFRFRSACWHDFLTFEDPGPGKDEERK